VIRLEVLALSAALAGPNTAAFAQSMRALDTRAAQAIIAGCVAQSVPKMQSHAIVVVDTGGP
jgi:hypothetical protein